VTAILKPIEGDVQHSIKRALASISKEAEDEQARGLFIILVKDGSSNVITYTLNLNHLEANGALLQAIINRATTESRTLPTVSGDERE